MPHIDIKDADDPRLEPYRDIKDRDLAGRGGLFMAEGKVVLERLFASKLYETVSVLTTEARLATLDVSGLDAPVYVVPQTVMDQVAGFPIHRGYLALGRARKALSLADVVPPGRTRLLGLSGIANTDNMGGLMRNAAAFGVDAVLLDATCCDPLYRKAIRVSVGGVLAVPFVRVGDMVGALRDLGITPYALSPSGGAAA
ncbi:TrmH family RNA methyltransferase [Asticcacaulis sp. EMRT-3]|uniref:TrmH family RNA methyltransferase n=1 Tax=Asticcacaulis sp. EMRT-3 TaxID=3040349 RepID=UPI0032C24A25